MRSLVTLVIVCILLLGVVQPGCSSSPPTTTLTIFSITEGAVYVMKAGTDTWVEAQVGMVLGPGDMIKTGDDSGAVITFFDGTTVELEAGTEIELILLGYSADTDSTTIRIGQTIGSIIFRVTKLIDPASSYDVETPTGEASVRGSAMRVEVAEDGTTQITNLQGNIWAIAQGVEVQIPEGQQCIIRSEEPPEIISEPEEVTFADANLEAAVREAIEKEEGPIYAHEVAGLIHLNANGRGVSDLSGLEYATGLTGLYLTHNEISELAPLAGLTNLTRLELQFNEISDISALAGLTNLERLYFHLNQVNDISPLADLTGLRTLYILGNSIEDISPLAGLTSIVELWLGSNEIEDISPLASLTGLESLSLNENQIVDISHLAGMTNLTHLNLGFNSIEDVSTLEGLIGLTELYLPVNQIDDASPLGALVSLTRLNLSNNQIEDISELAGLTELEWLYLSNNQIVDISSLGGMTKLTDLSLGTNQVVDISALEFLISLEWLYLRSNQIVDIQPLVDNAGLGEGDEVDLRDNPLSETSYDDLIPELEDRGVIVYADEPD